MPVTELASPAEIRAQMNWGSDTTYDAEAAPLFVTVTQIIERLSGHTIPATFTQAFDDVCGDPTLILPETPVQSISSLVDYHGATPYTLTSQPVGQAVDYYGYSIDDADAGFVTRRGAYSTRSTFGRVVIATWTAGRATVPAPIKSAALELFEHLWNRSQHVSGTTFNDDTNTDTLASPSTFVVPKAVAEMLSPYTRGPGMH